MREWLLGNNHSQLSSSPGICSVKPLTLLDLMVVFKEVKVLELV